MDGLKPEGPLPKPPAEAGQALPLTFTSFRPSTDVVGFGRRSRRAKRGGRGFRFLPPPTIADLRSPFGSSVSGLPSSVVFFAFCLTPKPPKGGLRTDSEFLCRKFKVPPGGFRGLPSSVSFFLLPFSFCLFPLIYSYL